MLALLGYGRRGPATAAGGIAGILGGPPQSGRTAPHPDTPGRASLLAGAPRRRPPHQGNRVRYDAEQIRFSLVEQSCAGKFLAWGARTGIDQRDL